MKGAEFKGILQIYLVKFLENIYNIFRVDRQLRDKRIFVQKFRGGIGVLYFFNSSFQPINWFFLVKFRKLRYIWTHIRVSKFFRSRNHHMVCEYISGGSLGYYNTNLVLSGGQAVHSALKFYRRESIGYFLIRWYIYMLQFICNVRLSYYLTRVDVGGIWQLIPKQYIWFWFHGMVKFLKKFRVTKMFLLFLIYAILSRDVLIILKCVRKLIMKLRSYRCRFFFYIFYSFLVRVLNIFSWYCGVRGFKFIFSGKFGRGGSQRSQKYIIESWLSKRVRGNYWNYNYIQIRLALGTIGVKGFLMY